MTLDTAAIEAQNDIVLYVLCNYEKEVVGISLRDLPGAKQDWIFKNVEKWGGALLFHDPEHRGIPAGFEYDQINITALLAENVALKERLARIDVHRAVRCDSGSPDCGPVEYTDADDVPLCAECWDHLCNEATQGPNDE